MESRENKKQEYLLELAIFMMSSARDVIKSQHYGTNRLLSSLTKVLYLPNQVEGMEKDGFLEEIRGELEKARPLMKDSKALSKFLDEMIVKMLKEYRHRLTSD